MMLQSLSKDSLMFSGSAERDQHYTKIKFSTKDCFSKYDQIQTEKILNENFIFCAV